MRFSLLFLGLFLLGAISLHAQLPVLTADNFETTVLSYEPELHAGISKHDVGFAKMVLDQTRSASDNEIKSLNRADYFNILSVFTRLKENPANIQLAFEKFVIADDDCSYLHYFANDVYTSEKYAPVKDVWRAALNNCGPPPVKEPIDIASYVSQNKLDKALVLLMQKIDSNDQLFRATNDEGWAEKQRPLDLENQRLVDSLYRHYGHYLGKDAVGGEFDEVMWMVVQHSNIEMMKRYLPVIRSAVEIEQLSKVPLKMLIDRITSTEYGWQVFGSQGGVPRGTDRQCAEIKNKYNLK